MVLFINDSTDFPEIIASWMNPWNLGNGHTWFCLNWHLWFIPAFLAVTLIFPLIKSRALSKISDAFLLALICAVFVALSFSRHWFMSTVAFYLIWYFLGYKLESDWKISNRQLLVLAVSGVIVLVVGVTKFQATLDMQVHKFPPNYMFLGFSAIWVSMALFLAPKVPQGWIDFLADNWFVKLFISRGYSLYLWQGLGYATAVLLAHKMGWNVFVTWLVAVLITIVLGTLAAPLERVRWKQTFQTDRRYQVGTSQVT